MKTEYTISVGEVTPPAEDVELALFTAALSAEVTQQALTSLGIKVTPSVTITHNTNSDDPPDIEAFGLGWECTEFPPNQSALWKVREHTKGPMAVPGYSQTGRQYKDIKTRVHQETVEPTMLDVLEEKKSLADAFLQEVIGGPKSKDVPGNHVLLLDHRQGMSYHYTTDAIGDALRTKHPKHLKLILLVGFRPYQAGDTHPVPHVERLL